MSRSKIAVIVLGAGPGRRRAARPGPVLPASGGGRDGEHRGVHRRRQGGGRGQAEPAGDRPGGLRRLGADRRRDRQVPRRQEAAPGGVRRAEARQRRRRGAGLLVDQKGQMFNPYFFDVPAQPPGQDRGPAHAEARRQRRPTSARWTRRPLLQLVAKLLDVAQDAGGKVGRRRTTSTPTYYYGYDRRAPGPGPVRPRRLRQAPGGGLREGDRRRPGAGRAAGQAEPASSSGRSSAVREVVVPGEQRQRRTTWRRGRRRRPASGWSRSKFQEIPVRVELLVRFDVASQGRRPTGRAGEPMSHPRPRRDRPPGRARPAARSCGVAAAGLAGRRGLARAVAPAPGAAAARRRKSCPSTSRPRRSGP